MSRSSCTIHAALIYGLCVAILSTATPARAYVRTTTQAQTPIAWRRSCVFITPDSRGSADTDSAATQDAIAAATEAWNIGAAECNAHIRFIVETPLSDARPGFTTQGLNRNVIVWREDHWGNEEMDYDPSAVALTTLTFVSDKGDPQDGEILDADIELNGVHHTFSAQSAGQPGKYDIQNTLTHELGHVLGLDHPCDDGTIVPTPTDHLGQTIPSCQPEWRLPTEIKESTMYNYSGLAEIKKRTLEPDDKAGVCAIYPASADPELCEPIRFHPQDCGCNQISASGDPVGLSLPFWLAALGLYVLTRRSRRKTTVVSR